jgi:hypothetical protein
VSVQLACLAIRVPVSKRILLESALVGNDSGARRPVLRVFLKRRLTPCASVFICGYKFAFGSRLRHRYQAATVQ